MRVLKKLGWDKDLTAAELATIQRIGGNKPDTVSWAIDLSGGIQRVAMEHGCIHYGNGKARANAFGPARRRAGASRADLHAAHGAGRRSIRRCRTGGSSACRTSASTIQKDNVENKIGKKFPIILTSGRLVEYEGGGEETALQQVARRAAAGHVHRDQSCGRHRRATSRTAPGSGSTGPSRRQGQGQGDGDRARRQGRGVDAVPLRRLVPGRRSARQVPEGRGPHTCSARA